MRVDQNLAKAPHPVSRAGTQQPHPRDATWGGALLFIAGFTLLMGFITGEATYPAGYSTTRNTISDLGGTLPPNSVMFEPTRTIFIVTVLTAGAMILAATFAVYRAFHRRALAVAMIALGVGVVGVGVFPGDTGTPHLLLSMVAFLGGASAAIASRRVLVDPFRVIAVALGVIALVATILGVDQLVTWGPGAEIGVGGMERWIVYPVLFWMAGFGAYLLGRVGKDQRGTAIGVRVTNGGGHGRPSTEGAVER